MGKRNGDHLTQDFVKRIKLPESGYAIYWDYDPPGFGLRVMASGTATYIIRHEVKVGKKRQRKIKKLCRAELVTPKVAREMARDKLAELASGSDDDDYYFEDLCEDYIRRQCPKLKSGENEERVIRKDIIPIIGHLAASAVERKDVRAVAYKVLDERDKPVMANRVQSIIGRIFVFGMDEGLVKASPAVRLKRIADEEGRQRFLTEKEIPAWWKALDELLDEDWNSREALKMILATGRRNSEVAGMRWDEIDGDWWTVPGVRIKTPRGKTPADYRCPLSPLAMSILAGIPRLGEYVFPTRRGGKKLDPEAPLTANAIDHVVARIRPKMDIEHWTPHDLRRTCATHLGRLGLGSYDWIVMNHTPRGVTKKVYNLYEHDREKRIALNTWGDEIVRLLEDRKAAVVSISKEGGR